MSRQNVSLVLRADALFNLFAGVVLYIFQKPILALLLLPDSDKPIYPQVLGAALIGLSLDAWFVSNNPDRYKPIMLAGIITRLLVAPVILYWLFIGGIDLPPIWLGVAAVAAQVLFILGEALYLYATRQERRMT